VRIENRTRGTELAATGEVAAGMIRRGVGLMGRRAWTDSDGLVLEHCNSIHTFFMRMPIDVAYLDREDRVVRLIGQMAPWRVGPIAFEAKRVVELPAGTLERTGTQLGDRLALGS
jgi:uncharacterized membrane protein (UPF0127 family)